MHLVPRKHVFEIFLSWSNGVIILFSCMQKGNSCPPVYAPPYEVIEFSSSFSSGFSSGFSSSFSSSFSSTFKYLISLFLLTWTDGAFNVYRPFLSQEEVDAKLCTPLNGRSAGIRDGRRTCYIWEEEDVKIVVYQENKQHGDLVRMKHRLNLLFCCCWRFEPATYLRAEEAFFSNPEAFASEFLENLEDMFLCLVGKEQNYCVDTTTIFTRFSNCFFVYVVKEWFFLWF